MGHLANARAVRLGFSKHWWDAWFSPKFMYAEFTMSCMRIRYFLIYFFFSKWILVNLLLIFSHVEIIKRFKNVTIKTYYYDGHFERSISEAMDFLRQRTYRTPWQKYKDFKKSMKEVRKKNKSETLRIVGRNPDIWVNLASKKRKPLFKPLNYFYNNKHLNKLPMRKSLFKNYNFIEAEAILNNVLIHDLTKQDRNSLWLVNGYYLHKGYYGSAEYKHPLTIPQRQAWEELLNTKAGRLTLIKPTYSRIRFKERPSIKLLSETKLNKNKNKSFNKQFLMKVVYLSFDGKQSFRPESETN